MKVTQSFKSDEVHTRILKMLYAAVYSEVYQNREWRDFAFEEFNSLASVGDFLPRTFNCGGRLFLCFAFNWLVNNGIVQYSDRLGERINRLFYRNEIIWRIRSSVEEFRTQLRDRFGAIPATSEELIKVLPLRIYAKRLGI